MEQEMEGTDLLYGVPAIAQFLGLGNRQVYHLKDTGSLPTFTLGDTGKVCALKSTLRTWLRDQEAKARSAQ
ncbi:DNA-binding protein [Brucella intermedia]|uniref:DNA-binding protein n=1 Tax=Brucella intermedia TaxID=94625 RepID=UPI00209ADBAD|nr:DNA-binding protein [Brucella intermedia]MCO7736435.1 DNA-binding protein [Brucella intermedia]